MKKVTMRVKGLSLQWKPRAGQSCRTEELQKLYDSLGLEVESDMETPEASSIEIQENA